MSVVRIPFLLSELMILRYAIEHVQREHSHTYPELERVKIQIAYKMAENTQWKIVACPTRYWEKVGFCLEEIWKNGNENTGKCHPLVLSIQRKIKKRLYLAFFLNGLAYLRKIVIR